ncbi:unnamed protein product [Acanthoscelides obtectus]|nr:unnamed protein product [Acanthoscelides obtectus]CAK1621321.1 hypothetical protein AOBTE_LOCUS893 [Acanthoscelides obtectus]
MHEVGARRPLFSFSSWKYTNKFSTSCRPSPLTAIPGIVQFRLKIDNRSTRMHADVKGTVGSCFSTTLGSVLHELYHTFDLGHSKDGIMGRGFDNICKVFTNPQICKSSSFHNKIEFKEQLSTCSLKHVDKNMKKDFTVIRRTEEVDDTLLTKSCAVLLSFHRWLNNYPTQTSHLSFDSSNKVVKSTAGVRVVEIRQTEDELILQSWVFISKVLKFSFQIPQNVLSELNNQNLIILVEDSIGTIIKEEFVA